MISSFLVLLQDQFTNKLVVGNDFDDDDDIRLPIVTFQVYVPGIEGTTTTFAILPPMIEWWYQLTILHIICVSITSFLAFLVYQFIIVPNRNLSLSSEEEERSNNKRQQQQQGNKIITFSIAFGVIIPLALIIPYILIEFLDLQNKFLAQCCSAIPTVVVFRTLEALYGTASSSSSSSNRTPQPKTISTSTTTTESSLSKSSLASSSSGTTTTTTTELSITKATAAPMEVSLSNYIQYYSSLTYCQWCTKTQTRITVTKLELVHHIINFVLAYIGSCIMFSWLIPYNYQPFTTSVQLEEWHIISNTNTGSSSSIILLDLFSWQHLLNMYILGCFSSMVLSALFQMNALRDNIQGYATCPVFGNPIFESSSPSEFWSKKWNLTLQKLLKRGVYLPARHYVSKTVAMFFTFFISGLTHEYYSTLLSFHDDCDPNNSYNHNMGGGDGELEAPTCFVPIYSKLLAFFAWNGVVVLLERPLSKTSFCQGISQWLPLPILSALVLLPVLPVGHWFVGEWVAGGFFAGLSLGFFRIVKVSM